MQAKATEKWIEQIDYNKEDWQEIDDRRQIDLDLEASVLEGQEGTT